MNDTPDPLDTLLERTTPPGVDTNPTLRRELASMSYEARQASLPPRRRPTRIAVGAGLVVLFVGGASAAVATTMFNWAPWAQDPDVVYSFTLPSDRECEARVQMLDVTNVNENGQVTTAYDRDLADHFRAMDAIGAADIDGAMREVLARDTSVAMVAVNPDGSVSDVMSPPEGPSEDDVYVAAVYDALGDVLRAEALTLGLSDAQWSTNMEIQCAPVAE
ncbi:MAG: hypothetical protein ACYC2K_11120 [Gemmatimonadales bacterium]